MTKWTVYRDEDTHRWIATKDWRSDSFPSQPTAFRYAFLQASVDRIDAE